MTKIEEIVHAGLDGVVTDEHLINTIAKAINDLVLTHVAELGKDIALNSMCLSCLQKDSTFNVCTGCGISLKS